MIPYNILHIGLFLIFIFFITIYFLFYNSNNIVAVEDDNYMHHFDVYGDFLFQIYGILGIIKSIFDEFNNFDEFNTFFNEIKEMLQYRNGDSIEIKAGKVDFSTKIVQRKYNKTQTYMEVLYPLNQQYHIVFYRIIKYLDLSDINTPNRDTNQYHFKQLIKETKLSSANKDILTNFNESALLEPFTTALGYTYVFQYFIHKYDDFEKALNVIKKYHKLFITKYGESMFIRKNTNTITPFSFQNNNANYIFQNDDWLVSRLGVLMSERSKYLIIL